MSLRDEIVAIETMLKFCRNLKTKDDLLLIKEMLEHAFYFQEEAHKLLNANSKNLEPLLRLAKLGAR